MIAQGVTRVRMEKYIQHAVVQRQPFDNAIEVWAVEHELIRPLRMGTYRTFMETTYLRDAPKRTTMTSLSAHAASRLEASKYTCACQLTIAAGSRLVMVSSSV
ncbi:hypothetical protein CF70_034525 [Cupriavidus sp. SK-3]|nr:hypothetical protein CF70_034525 [Cupriavidus sp. SK-3]